MLIAVALEILVGFSTFAETGSSRALESWVIAATTLAVTATGGAGLLLFRMSVRHGRLEADRLVAAEMEHAARLAEVGRLSAAIAHEIHNPLQGVNGYLALLERETGDAEKRRAHTAAIRAALQKIEKLTKDVLDAANPSPPRRVTVSPGDLLHSVEKALEQDPRFVNIRFVTEIEGGVSPIFVDASAIERILLNLTLNARESLGGRGEIRLCARRAGAERVEVEVRDDGPGVSAEMKQKLFEPFRSGRGSTGLGLWICNNLARANGGSIRYEDAPRGARFIITIPVT
ncbi:MAG: hypothetical protein HY286_13280 [Planctomycetes bacterium]|nr:hypothetical protein [Planctomycetota bacterium]